MSERANGWLLIFGGLAIGLVLWLSPAQSAPTRNFASVARQSFAELLRRMAEGRETFVDRFEASLTVSDDLRITL